LTHKKPLPEKARLPTHHLNLLLILLALTGTQVQILTQKEPPRKLGNLILHSFTGTQIQILTQKEPPRKLGNLLITTYSMITHEKRSKAGEVLIDAIKQVGQRLS